MAKSQRVVGVQVQMAKSQFGPQIFHGEYFTFEEQASGALVIGEFMPGSGKSRIRGRQSIIAAGDWVTASLIWEEGEERRGLPSAAWLSEHVHEYAPQLKEEGVSDLSWDGYLELEHQVQEVVKKTIREFAENAIAARKVGRPWN